MSIRKPTRRILLKSSALAGIVLLRNPRSAFSFQANEKLNLAHVGCGGRGRELLLGFSPHSNTVALCDVNSVKATEMYRRFPDVPKFEDFRVMLDKMGSRIDAVVTATPDHIHAVSAAAAIRAGKHVYTEKPLTRTITESRILQRLAAEHRVATSMGNQGTASGPFRRALELLRSGAIGEIQQVLVWNDSGGASHAKFPTEQPKTPPYLNWDLWLGPAQARPFHPQYLGWSQWRDFGTGQLGNWASHTANLAFMALEVASLWSAGPESKGVIRVQAQVDSINPLSFPRWEAVTWKIPARAKLGPIEFHWYNGSRAPGARDQIESMLGRGLDWGDKGEKKWADFAGCLIVGAKGRLHATGHNATFALLPETDFGGIQRERPETVEASQGHERDFLAACRGGKKAWANFDYASPLNQFLQLANHATRFEGPLDFDPVAGEITNHKEANAALKIDYREGWSL